MEQAASRGWKKRRGNRGEQLALDYLMTHGYHLLVQNYRFERGEIDLIAEEDNVIVFVEVKTRRSKTYGDPEHSVTVRKQAQIRKVAKGYLHEHGIHDRACRFDVVAITLTQTNPQIVHYKNAFY